VRILLNGHAPPSPAMGKVGAVLGPYLEGLGHELVESEADADAMVDFTAPEAVVANVLRAVEAGVPSVVGTTGWSTDVVDGRARAAGVPVFFAPNFAIGAVLMMQAAQLAAKHMPECEIVELHHDRKVDAPSGTAKRTAELISEAGGNVHEPIHSIRLPGLVAHQEVIFGGEGQTLSIRHDSIDRHSFMPGVVLAVREVGSMPERFVVGLENLL
jgi:4-hydroxy-tetrahydrodipicolinate reductase